MSTLRYFRDEYLKHIVEKKCPAGVCTAMVRAKCVNACPAGVDVPTYLALVAQGKYGEALEDHRKRNPFALVCGRVCPAFCEHKCRRGDIDEPVAIRQVKRFMADEEIKKEWTPPRLGADKKEKVAVVGSGPAGLTAALRLAQLGYKTTVFESLPVAGGMLAVGIPDYRLPRDVLNAEIDNVRRAGVDIQLNKALGQHFSVDSLMSTDGYSAVVLALGAHNSRRLGIPGESTSGVVHGTDFLREAALGKPLDLAHKKVAVIGGGNVAIDSARMALRLGAAEVHVVYRRTRDEMPAYKGEITAAEQEGIVFHYLANPTRILGDGQVTALRCLRQSLGDFESSGRRKPVAVEGSDFDIAVDVVIPAIGQEPNRGWMGSQEVVKTKRDGTFQVSHDLETSRHGVFAAGDAVLGPATVVEAIAEGNRVANSVHAYLRGESGDGREQLWGEYATVDLTYNLEDYADTKRVEAPELPVDKRKLPVRATERAFPEVELGLSKDAAILECKRCLRCDLEQAAQLAESKKQG